MKKIFMLLSLVAMMLTVVPVSVSAADSLYNVEMETVKDSNGDNWHTSSNGGKVIVKDVYVSKTNAAGYVYIAFIEKLNVKIKSLTVDDAFEQVGDYVPIEGGRAYVFKLKNGTSINKKTKLAQIAADIIDPTDSSCDLFMMIGVRILLFQMISI